MKKVISLVIMVSLMFIVVTSAYATEDTVSPSVYTLIDAMDIDQLTELKEYVDQKITEINALPLDTSDDSEPIEATRSNPALVGDRVVLEYGTGEIAITVLNSFSGEAAALFAKSFDRFNTSSFTMGKGSEWLLQYIKIEGISSLDDRIELSDYYFHLISDTGIDLGFSYITENPLPISSMYAGATQYCWFGLVVPKGTKAYLSFDDTFSSPTAWFDISQRRVLDTSATEYPMIEKNETGETVLSVQMMLVEYGFLTKVPSGKFDSSTIAALKKFQKAHEIEPTGIADTETLRLLFSGKPIGNN